MRSYSTVQNIVDFSRNKLKTLKYISEKSGTSVEKHSLILVHHIMPTHVPFIQILADHFSLEHIIGIPYSSTLNNVVTSNGTTINIERYDLEIMPSAIASAVGEVCSQNKNVLLLEVGGYFAKHMITHPTQNWNRLVGVIEDTTAGWHNYRELNKMKLLTFPVGHVARSTLKEPEDHLTGEAIAHSAEVLLRSMGDILVGKKVLVIGFGRIGESCSHAFRSRHTNVSVWDRSSVKMVLASAKGFTVENRDELLSQADIIVGATGFKSISKDDFSKLKDGCILLSGSSKDIEFDIKGLEELSISSNEIIPEIRSYSLENDKRLLLLNHGHPVNFLHLGSLGSSIDLVMTELFVLVQCLASNQYDPGLYVLDNIGRDLLAEVWLKQHKNIEMSKYPQLASNQFQLRQEILE